MNLKKVFFFLFTVSFCFSPQAEEESSSAFNFLDEEYYDIPCSDLPKIFTEEYKNDVQRSHSLSPLLTDLKMFLETVKSTQTISLEEFNAKIKALEEANAMVSNISSKLEYKNLDYNYSLEQCIEPTNERNSPADCLNLPNTFNEYTDAVKHSHRSLYNLLSHLKNFLETLKNDQSFSFQTIEEMITILEEARTIISENKNLLDNEADNISFGLNKCLNLAAE